MASGPRAGPIGWQVELRQLACELFAPERAEALSFRSRQHLGLPSTELLVAGPSWREHGGTPGRVGVVEQAQILHEDPERPAVGDDLVGHQREDMILVGDPEERRPEHGPVLEVEGPVGLVRDLSHQVRIGRSPHVHNPECVDPVVHLGPHGIVPLTERGPEGVVAIRHSDEALSEGATIHLR